MLGNRKKQQAAENMEYLVHNTKNEGGEIDIQENFKRISKLPEKIIKELLQNPEIIPMYIEYEAFRSILEKVRSVRTIQHILNGEIYKKRAKGCHHKSIQSKNTFKVISPKNKQKIYRAKIKIYNEKTGRLIKKENPSSMFPNDWNQEKVLESINNAHELKRRFRKNIFEGIDDENNVGIIMKMKKTKKIYTAYPIYE